MRVIGWLLVLAAIIPLGAGLGMDTSVPTGAGGRVHNIGLMREQQNALLIGALMLVVGVGLVIAGRRPGASSCDHEQADEKACPYCAERIKRAAVVCRYCGRDLQPTGPTRAGAEQLTPELLERLGVRRDGDRYRFGDYAYDRAEDAVAYARRQQRPGG